MKSALAILVTSLLFFGLMPFAFPGESALAAQAADSGNVRSLAESQHEIVMLLLKKDAYDQALVEANKLFELKWPEDQEPVLLKEALYFAGQFLRGNKASMSLSLLENSAKHFKKPSSLAAIWKEKGYVYKQMNQDEKALECFKEAQRLETTGTK
jgi:tetratricopeptide (TPR) repeat protein